MTAIRLLFLVALLVVLVLAGGFGQQLGARWSEHETALVAVAAVGMASACGTPAALVLGLLLLRFLEGRRRARPAPADTALDGQWRELPPATTAPPMFVDATGGAFRRSTTEEGSGLALPAQAQESWRA